MTVSETWVVLHICKTHISAYSPHMRSSPVTGH